MAETSKISWTDATFNPWIGCSKVSPACHHCYAERDMDHRYHKVAWGPSGTRVVTSDNNWKQPLKWNRDAEKEGVRKRVFCASLSDVMEDWDGPMLDHHGKVLSWCMACKQWIGSDRLSSECCGSAMYPITMKDVRERLFLLMDNTPNLDWLVLTKRPENILRLTTVYNYDACASGDCPHERASDCNPHLQQRDNVWFGCSVENQKYADERIPELLKCRNISPVLFLSCEPLLGPVDLTVDGLSCAPCPRCIDQGPDIETNVVECRKCDSTGIGEEVLIDWVIAGGESGPEARPSHPDWFRSLRDQCQAASIPFHFKQWGEFGPATSFEPELFHDKRIDPQGRDVTNESGLWSDEDAYLDRDGVKTTGRILDRRSWDEVPVLVVR